MTTTPPVFPGNKVPALVKVCQVAELFAVCKPTVYKLIESGQLEGADISAEAAQWRHLRVTRDSLLRFYKKRFGHSLERALANNLHEA
jgi:hypothetical protein